MTDAEKKPETGKQAAEKKPEATEAKSVKLYNANDGLHGRDGGPYLDEVEALRHERINAAKEGREVDLNNVNSYPGIVLRTPAQQIAEFNPMLIAGDDRRTFEDKITAPEYTTTVVEQPVATDQVVDGPLDDNPADNGLRFADLDKIG